MFGVLALACHVSRAPRLEPTSAHAAELAAPMVSATTSDVTPAPPERTVASGARCPSEMALLSRPQGDFCVDRWEASLDRATPSGGREPWPSNLPVEGHEAEVIATSVPGRKPQGYISGAQAEMACANANKRLCAIDEWLRACQGPRRTTYPYGNERRLDACNDRSMNPPQHPVVRLFERFAPPEADRAEMWLAGWMNDPRLHELPDTVEPTGSRPECTNEYGVYDMVGNLHEWIADPEGTFVGGFFMDTVRNGDGCSYRTSAHNIRYHDYSTGFRCCADALLQ